MTRMGVWGREEQVGDDRQGTSMLHPGFSLDFLGTSRSTQAELRNLDTMFRLSSIPLLNSRGGKLLSVLCTDMRVRATSPGLSIRFCEMGIWDANRIIGMQGTFKVHVH
jgi:hypothetical protein